MVVDPGIYTFLTRLWKGVKQHQPPQGVERAKDHLLLDLP